MKSIVKVIFLFSLLMFFASLNSPVNASENQCIYCHDLKWEGIKKVIVLRETNKDSKIIQKAKELGLEIEYSEDSGNMDRTYSYFSSLYLFYRDNEGITVSVTPNSFDEVSNNIDDSWAEIYRYIQWHPLYNEVENDSKESSLWNQSKCHVNFIPKIAPWKTTWNLEASRPDKGYWGFVASSCN